MDSSHQCRICKSDTELKWPSNLESKISSDSFAITDAHYGQTSAIYQCKQCGFRQCNELQDVLSFYENLEDQEYENGRKERYLQAQALLKELQNHCSSGRLLDVGAGSGILVEAALETGYQAEGIEPSTWLQEQAAERKLPVKKGILSDLPLEEAFDAITLIDVIEHVVDPIGLLKEINERLSSNGYAMIVTPDCQSFFARLLRRKWWHYRVAHIGYFDLATLKASCHQAGLEVVSVKRPGWFFTMDYLWVRLMQYVPRWMRCKPMNWMKRRTVSINLRDSLLVTVRSKRSDKNGES